MKVKVEVFLKEVVLDPQGKTIHKAIQSLGYDSIRSVRAGKIFFLDVDAESSEEAERLGAELAQKLLANTVIENSRVIVEP